MNYMTQFKVKAHDFTIVSTEKGVRYFNNDAIDEVYGRMQLTEDEVTLGETARRHNERYIEDITRYFNGEKKAFDWSFDLSGTEFQQDIWRALQTIDFGKTTTYGHVATQIGRPKAVRAAGGAIGKNPVLIVIPCHRVIGKNGQLTGFSSGIPLKKELLEIEGIAYKE